MLIVLGFGMCAITPHTSDHGDVCAGFQPAGSVWGLQTSINQIAHSVAMEHIPVWDDLTDW